MSLAEPNHDVFDFFALPAELRDMAYDNLRIWLPYSFDIEVPDIVSFASVVDLLPDARLVCRQFQQEAEKRVQRSETLTVLWLHDSECGYPSIDLSHRTDHHQARHLLVL